MTSDLSDDDALAAEYVLGTLEADERAAAEARRSRDIGFDGLIAQWEARLAPLAEATPPLAPPDDLYPKLLHRLPALAPWTPADNILIIRRKLRLWRGVAAGTSALAAALALWVVAREALPPVTGAGTYVAVLQQGAGQPSFVVSLDTAHHRMSVLPLAASAPAGKSFEVWMIDGDHTAPRSMGVIDAATPLKPVVPNVAASIMSNATYAVTVEPLGGSPTGQPTSAPLFVGKPVATSL
ncbi:anti-sigma factor [Lichenihabitans sp. Uapishka_5]|uniref:anti-sigma factor n=1 Tax=Lichenihabitans sp. Uapishka_5 TaxID=3037302 RepID=UPI0029E7D297|nr:anti-sigma factor [Lichenihabitans sp. Uapishka_5]MDX7949842.1 anti-sigma factor [Lichenihabitans sp. Uapishka_5]